MPPVLKSAVISAAALAPSLLVSLYLIDYRIPVQYSSMAAYVILLWAVLDFIIIVIVEPYRRLLGPWTIPAFVGGTSIVLLYVIAAALNRFFDHMGYSLLSPFTGAVVLLTCGAVFREKNLALKSYLSLSIIMLVILWAMGDADKVNLPF